MKKKNAKRSDASNLIEEIRLALSEELEEERESPFTEKLECLFKKANISLKR